MGVSPRALFSNETRLEEHLVMDPGGIGGRGRRDQPGATLVDALPMAIQIQLRADGLGWMWIL